MEIRLAELASHLGATLQGDGNYCVSGVASLETAQAQHLSFLSSKKFAEFLASTQAGAVILKDDQAEGFLGNALIVDDPYLAYAKVSALFEPRRKQAPGVHPSAVVAASAQIDPNASIGAHVTIGENVVIGPGCELYPNVFVGDDSRLGANCLIHANVSIYAGVSIGDDCIIHANTAIGSDGFGFSPSKAGWVKIHQLGGVEIGNRVEIGACTSIDRGAIGNTVIHDGVIIDNQVHLAHNVEIGENTAIAGCVGIAGSTKIGKNCTLAGNVIVNGHIEIADNCHFNGGTVVTKGCESGAYGSTTPMQDVKSWRKSAVRFTQLDEMAARLKKLEKALASDN